MSGFGGYGASPQPGQDPTSGQGGGSAVPGPYGQVPFGQGGHGGPVPGGYGQQPGAPVCPRHPDRVSYVTCQRCGRPTCSECQRPATVGIHCVDCVREAQRSRPVTRTALGGVDRGTTPIITYSIIGICVVLELLRYLAPGLYVQLLNELMFWPAYGASEPYRFVTSTFLHGGIWHLAFNMYALYLVGGELERILGRARYLTLYLLSAVGGSVAYLVIAGVGAVPAVGASGGVFGLFAAFAITLRRFGRDPRQILVLIGINAVLGFVIAGIAWQAHLGGLVVGGAVAALFAYVPRDKVWVQWAGAAVVLAILAGVSVAILA